MNVCGVDNANCTATRRTDLADPKLAGLRETTNKLVGSVFFGTLLRTLRSSTLKGEYGHGGRGEEVFMGQLDQILAERAGQSRTYDLGEAILRRFAEQQLRVMRLQECEAGNCYDEQEASLCNREQAEPCV